MRLMLILAATLVTAAVSAQDTLTCKGSLPREGANWEEGIFTITPQHINHVARYWAPNFSTQVPAFQFQFDMDPVYLTVTWTEREYVALDVIIDGTPNWFLKVDLETMQGHFQSYSMPQAMPLTCAR
jgi:hypothetical protein